MSNQAVGFAFKCVGIPKATTRFVHVALADCVSEDGLCWPSMFFLQLKTSLDRKTILAAVGWLAAQGYITETEFKTGATSQVKVYRFNYEVQHESNSTENGTVRKQSQKRTQRVPFLGGKSPKNGLKQYQKRDTESSLSLNNPNQLRGAVDKPVSNGKRGASASSGGSAFSGFQISDAALDRCREVAPGWDRQYLVSTFQHFLAQPGRTQPGNPDAAFIAWAKKFTGGKQP